MSKIKVVLPNVHFHLMTKRFRHNVKPIKLHFFNVSFNSEELHLSYDWAKFLSTVQWEFQHKQADEPVIFTQLFSGAAVFVIT